MTPPMFFKFLMCATLVLAAGCISPPRQPMMPPSMPSDIGAAPGRTRESVPSAATMLLSQARSDREAGALASAESAIERALRIEPNDPWLWIELGEIKRATGDGAQAAAMGRKALSLAAGDRAVETSARALLR